MVGSVRNLSTGTQGYIWDRNKPEPHSMTGSKGGSVKSLPIMHTEEALDSLPNTVISQVW